MNTDLFIVRVRGRFFGSFLNRYKAVQVAARIGGTIEHKTLVIY